MFIVIWVVGMLAAVSSTSTVDDAPPVSYRMAAIVFWPFIALHAILETLK
jgi:hypothetical protein